MASFNQIILIGRIGKDPELSFSSNGLPMCKYSVAVDNFGKDKTTSWFEVICFDKLAEICEKFLNKGSFIQIVGTMKQSKYKDKEGNNRTSWSVVANSMLMLDTKKSEERYEKKISSDDIVDLFLDDAFDPLLNEG